MIKDNFKKSIIVILSLIFAESLIILLYPTIGNRTGALTLLPSLVVAWYWGPLVGFAGALFAAATTSFTFYMMGMDINDFADSGFGIMVPFILSIALGFISNIHKKNKQLAGELEIRSNNLKSALDEKNNTEEMLLQKIDFIKFGNKISSDFINIHPLLIESRIESAVRHIFDFVNADSCCIYIRFKDDDFFSLYKELNRSEDGAYYRHIYRIEFDKISDLKDTFITQSFLEIDNQSWNHPLLEIFKGRSTILLPLLSNDRLIGLISFEMLSVQKDWSIFNNEVFPLTKQIIAYAFERKFAEEKISVQYDELKEYSESLFDANLKLNSLNETLLKTSVELKESEKKFRELSENIQDIIWLNSGKKVLYINPAYEKIWGKKRELLYKNALDFLDSVYPEDKKDLIEKFSSHDYNTLGMFQKEFRVFGKDGNVKWILARSFLIGNENGLLKTAGIAEDITLRKKAEEEIKNALDKAIQLNQLKTRFISTVSHELRTPLATILSSIELLKLYEDQMTANEKTDHFSKIISSIDYLTTLLDDVIIIDKTESGIVKVNYESFDLIELLKNIIDKISLMKNSNIRININASCDSFEIKSDKKLLTQILSNLLTNAVKFSPSKSKVEVEAIFDEENYSIRIIDHGIGIPHEAQNNIFIPFYRAENTENIQGTGLGLSIAKRWTDLLNGEITFNSKPNKGTTFIVKMPIKPGIKNEPVGSII